MQVIQVIQQVIQHLDFFYHLIFFYVGHVVIVSIRHQTNSYLDVNVENHLVLDFP